VTSLSYQAFEELKNKFLSLLILKFLSLLILKFSKFDKNFKEHMDASDFVIGGLLMHDGRPVSYETDKLDGCLMR
jgi:hypothetical protein